MTKDTRSFTNPRASVTYLTTPSPAFEESYLAVRQLEGRVYTPSQIRSLPDLTEPLLESHGWELRSQTAKRFRHYLLQRRQGLRILDVGCGNGWFTHLMSDFPKVQQVVGLDVNETELRQAAEVWGASHKLQWVYADIFTAALPLAGFELITFNASVQYFPDFAALIQRATELLAPEGEIHILDSPFYDSEEAQKAAQKRTLDYYTGLGHPELAAFYTPHRWSDVTPFRHEVLYRPAKMNRLMSRLGLAEKQNPFAWICIKKSE
jgi:SAM-dependent methyltransferase